VRRAAGVLAGAVALAACAGWGVLIHRNHVFPYRLLRSAYQRLRPAAPPRRFHLGRRGEAASAEALDQLARLPYLQGYRPATGAAGVSSYDPALAQDGWNLMTSGDAPVAALMDMDGTVRASWTAEAGKVFPGLALSGDDVERDRFFRCARLTGDGGIVAMFDQIGLVRLDASSKVVWAYRRRVHHDVVLEAGGGLWVLSHERRSAADLGRDGEIWEDFLDQLSPDGRFVRKISLFEALRRSSYAPLLALAPAVGDIFHTNSIQVLDGSLAARSPHFQRGNILISMHSIDTIAILDPDAGRIVWALSGQFRSQHTAQLLPSGRILLFDNLGLMRAASRALELDPFTQEIAWSYGGEPGQELLSETNGMAIRLSGGNTLIVESIFGRALEVTPEGRVVWQFLSPKRTGKSNELVATLYQLERVPREKH
jgi:hypothetical protein